MVLGGLLELGLASFRTCKVSEGALRTLKDICVQLNGLHSNGILHHDIKPDNLILYETKHELADFSLSVRGPVIHDTNVYTVWYRAPEVLLGQSHTVQADIWALGITFLHLLLGRPVFRDTTPEGALTSIIRLFGTQHYEPLVQKFGHRPGMLDKLVSPEAFAFLEKMLRVNPGLRISSKDLVHDPFWTGPGDAVVFYSTEEPTTDTLDYAIQDVPVLFKRVPLLIRVRIFDIFVKACDAFRVSKRQLMTAYYFWDTIMSSGMPWYAACFFAALCIECETVPDLQEIIDYFKISRDALVSCCFALPTLTRAPGHLDLDELQIYAIVEHPKAWFQRSEREATKVLGLTKTRATFLLL
jgi:hypothetical protein